ncbi:MAG: 1,4-alpha-glucan branching protein GlgB [Gammaproteobacteria bacterium]|nr:MAG: 1,4-alpha-glucan branching protein GlgB [Gammaproteobacteria bacterium]
MNPPFQQSTQASKLKPELQKIIDAQHHDPFSVLGRHIHGNQVTVRVFLPEVSTVTLGEDRLPLNRLANSDFFTCKANEEQIPQHYQLHCTYRNGQQYSFYDPYCFTPQLSEYDLHLFGEGRHWHIQNHLGAHVHTVNKIKGVLFATWAPNAERVSIVGDFNQWDGRRHPMRVRGGTGVWEIFIPGLDVGTLYKFEIRNVHSGQILQKTDPYGQQFELRPKTAAIVTDSSYEWQDNAWMTLRQQFDWLHQPTSIYEVHLGSWQRDENGHFLDYRELAHRLVDYVSEQGFTHIELLPITEHPLDASWGYQTTGYFAPTSRFGEPDAFRYFVDHCHRNNIGVLLDWVPAHFPKDAFGLARFDGSALYEHEDPRRGEHRDWGTLIYNYDRNEVKNYLLASALHWLEAYHIDGLRVDAVASMLYLDYSREEHDWIPNIHGGNENIEAIDFLRELNTITHTQQPGTIVIAEESTAWPQITRPPDQGGMGFSMKWNMGWMHDTLRYMSFDPIYRQHHHDQLTFGLLYAFTENFVLPFSHDEVVHGKSSMLYKMPGDEWQRFANLRLLYTYMFTYPGKKLLFMGCEFAQGSEWDNDKALDWYVLDYPLHQGIKRLISDLNNLYRNEPALYQADFEPTGFEWIDCNDSTQSTLVYQRKSHNDTIVVALNFTPVPRENFRIGVPVAGHYKEVVNSDSEFYAGSNMGNAGFLHSEQIAAMGREHSVSLKLPPLAAVVLKLDH